MKYNKRVKTQQQQQLYGDKKLNLSDVRERLVNYIDSRINYFSGGDEMKSMAESIRDEIFVRELKEMKKKINEDEF